MTTHEEVAKKYIASCSDEELRKCISCDSSISLKIDEAMRRGRRVLEGDIVKAVEAREWGKRRDVIRECIKVLEDMEYGSAHGEIGVLRDLLAEKPTEEEPTPGYVESMEASMERVHGRRLKKSIGTAPD